MRAPRIQKARSGRQLIQEVFGEWNIRRRQQGLSDEYVSCRILVVDQQYFDGGTDL